MKSIIKALAVYILLQMTSASGATYTYSTTVMGPIDFTAYVTLSYNSGLVTQSPQVTIFADAPLDAGAKWYMLGGTVTPTSITQTGFELDYPPVIQYGFNDSQVFNEMLPATWTIVPEPGSLGLLSIAAVVAIVRGYRLRGRRSN